MTHRVPCLMAGALLLLVAWPRTAPCQHVHGQASLLIGLEGSTGRVELRASEDDLYGFEREPRTAAERTRRDSAFTRLRRDGAQLVRFAPALGCRLTSDSVGVTRTRGHGEVFARWQVRCQQPVAGRALSLGVSRAFPGVDRVAVQLLSDTAQVGRTVVRDRGVLIP